MLEKRRGSGDGEKAASHQFLRDPERMDFVHYT